MRDKLMFSILYFLVLFDFIFFNIDIGLINITLLRVTIFLIFFYYLLSYLVKGKSNVQREVRKVAYVFVFWLIYMFTSFLWIDYPEGVIKSLYYYVIFLMLMYIIIRLISTEEKLLFLGNLFFTSAVLITLLGLFEFITGIRMEPSRYNLLEYINILEEFNKNAVTGMFHNENNYSLFLAICFPFVFLSLNEGNIFRRFLALVTTLLMFFLVVMNGAKLVIIMIAIEVFVIIILINITKFRKILLSIFLVFIAFFIALLDGRIFDNFGKISRQLELQDGSTFIRLNLLKNTKYVLEETNYLGSGITNFGYYLNPRLNFFGIVDPHNWWVELLSESGLLIFILVSGVFIWISNNLIKSYRNETGPSKKIYLALSATSIGFYIGSMSPSGLFFFWPMWMFLGISLAAINVYKRKPFESKNVKSSL